MSSNCMIEKIEKDGKCVIRLKGSIDEDFDGHILLNESSNKIFIDFQGVIKINSCGIREFIDVLAHISDKDLYYVNCPRILVDQINIVKGFITEKSIVLSFYAPYFCEETDEDHMILFKAQDIKNYTKAPEVKDSHGNDLEFDDFEEKYFKFLKAQEGFNG